MVDFVEICKVCVRKAIIEAAKRITNSGTVFHSYSDLNFGVTFLEHSVHALPALGGGGFLSTEFFCKINALLRRLKRFGYINYYITVTELVNNLALFHNIQSPLHCLHHILPASRTCGNLRDSNHNLQLPDYNSSWHKSLLLRMFSTALCNPMCFYV